MPQAQVVAAAVAVCPFHSLEMEAVDLNVHCLWQGSVSGSGSGSGLDLQVHWGLVGMASGVLCQHQGGLVAGFAGCPRAAGGSYPSLPSLSS